jgi:hypothetical protein
LLVVFGVKARREYRKLKRDFEFSLRMQVGCLEFQMVVLDLPYDAAAYFWQCRLKNMKAPLSSELAVDTTPRSLSEKRKLV